MAILSAETCRQFVKFGMVGVVGFAVDSAMLYVGIDGLGLKPVAAGFFSFPFSVTTTWIGNRLFTFRHAPKTPAARQLAKFAGICAVGLVFNRGTYSLLVSLVPLIYANPIIGLLAGTGVSMFFNFFTAKKHVFGDG